jgi:hypothetical protein
MQTKPNNARKRSNNTRRVEQQHKKYRASQQKLKLKATKKTTKFEVQSIIKF